jgi:hypothetical protein
VIPAVIPIGRAKITNISLLNTLTPQKKARFTSNADDTFFSELAIAKVSDSNIRNAERLNEIKSELMSMEQTAKRKFGDDKGGPLTLLTVLSRKRAQDKEQYEEKMQSSYLPMKLWHRVRNRPNDYMTWGEFKTHFDERRHNHFDNMLNPLIKLGLIVHLKYWNDRYRFQITDLGEEYVRSGGFNPEK